MLKFKVGDEVIVVKGCCRGSTGFIDQIDIDELPYHIRGVSWFEESELTLKSKVETEIPNENQVPNLELNMDSKMNLGFDDENESQDDFETIVELRIKVASLESELLNVYRELHRINKDS